MKLEAKHSEGLALYALSEWSMENSKLIQKIPVIEEVRFKIGKQDYSEPIRLSNHGHPPTFKMGQQIRLDGIAKYIAGIEPVFLLEGSQRKVCYVYTLTDEELETPIWWSTEIKTDQVF